MKWAVYSLSEKRSAHMKNFRKFSIVRIVVVMTLMSTMSFVKIVEPVVMPSESNIFAKRMTARIIIKESIDTNSSKSKVSKQWDDKFISGSGHSALGCD